MKIEGGCHCGRVRYEAMIDPTFVSICHCTDCQRLTGTAYRVSVRARHEDIAVLKGSPKTYVKTADSGAQRAQVFCGDCGSPLYTYDVADRAAVGIRIGSIDQRRELVPIRQIWCRSALDWAMNISELPRRERE